MIKNFLKLYKIFFIKNILKKNLNLNKIIYKKFCKKYVKHKIIYIINNINKEKTNKIIINDKINKEIINDKINKIKFFVFLGREKNIKIQHIYIQLLLNENIIDEYHMFDFSRKEKDKIFILNEYNRLSNIYNINNNLKIYLHNNDYENYENIKKTNWNPFYKYIYETSHENDVIIKCDDDILFIDIYSLKNAIYDRFSDKYSFLIHSNCINNGVCAYYQKDLFPKLKDKLNIYPKGGILGILFEKPEIAYVIHDLFVKDLINNIYNINKYIIDDVYIHTRISINFILINGRDTKYFKDIEFNDEYELSSYIPEKLLRPNKIKGNFITSHLSYSFQEKVLLSKDDLLNLYMKLVLNIYNNHDSYYLYFLNNPLINNTLVHIPKCVVSNNNIFKVKNWITKNHYYIKNRETNSYMYINYNDDEIYLSNNKKTLFEIYEINKNVYTINLGIYYLTRYNIQCQFKNENSIIKYLKDHFEKYIIIEDIDENGFFYIRFYKYKLYYSIKNDKTSNKINVDINMNKINKWIFEKNEDFNEYVNVNRYDYNKKFYYKNISNNEVYTNFYYGWGLENILE
jgi:hypothetical protein